MERLDKRTSGRLSTSPAEANPYMCVYLAQLSWLVVVREQGCWKLGTVERLEPPKDNRAPQPTGPPGMGSSARSQPHREPAGIGEPERSRSVSGPWTQA
jgi:hypothetical protein